MNKGENWDGWGWGGRVEEAAAIFMEAWRGKCFCCNCCCVLRGAKADDALHEILALPQAPHVAARLVPGELAKADAALHEILALPQAPHVAARLVPGELGWGWVGVWRLDMTS